MAASSRSPWKKLFSFFRKELMLTLSLLAAAVSLILTPPSMELVKGLDWHTLGTLFMMLCVLEGFKKEHIFNPLLRLAGRLGTLRGIGFFLVFSVFFTSMFVTNDVSLLIFVPLTILLYRAGGRETYILPLLTFENIAAVRGSLLTPFGSPQNLFLYSSSGIAPGKFLLTMLPLNVMSGILLVCFILFLFRKNPKEALPGAEHTVSDPWTPERKKQRIGYLALFVLILWTILSRTKLWPLSLAIVLLGTLFLDRQIFKKVDYVLLGTFLCFFVFSSSISANPSVNEFLTRAVGGREYWWGILLSQAISNVPAAIVLYPFTENLTALLYGVDTAGLCSLIGSLASVINYRLYVREYPGRGKKFILVFTWISWIFLAFVILPGFFLSKVM